MLSQSLTHVFHDRSVNVRLLAKMCEGEFIFVRVKDLRRSQPDAVNSLTVPTLLY